MKLPLVSLSDEFVVTGKNIEEHLKREEDECPNLATVEKKRKIDTAVRKIFEEELNRKEDSKRKWKSVNERLVQLKTGEEELKANNIALLSEENTNGMEVITDCLKIISKGLAMQGLAFGLIRCVH